MMSEISVYDAGAGPTLTSHWISVLLSVIIDGLASIDDSYFTDDHTKIIEILLLITITRSQHNSKCALLPTLSSV